MAAARPRHPVRSFIRLWLLCQALFWLAWLAAWLWLPDGALRGAGGAANLPLERLAFWPRLFGIVGANTVASLIVAALVLICFGAAVETVQWCAAAGGCS